MTKPIKYTQPTIKKLLRGEYDTIIDVRSPIEFDEDHVPGATNLPVLKNNERDKVGKIYKKIGPFEARRIGASLIAKNISVHLQTKLFDKPKNWQPLIYCWRGGHRSTAMAKIFSDIGWSSTLMDGGYKAYRKHVLDQLDKESKKLELIVVAGLTGTAKTHILRTSESNGCQVLDLESMANHRGSILGREYGKSQPPQKLFESHLCKRLSMFDKKRPVFVEAESNKIGRIQIPSALWDNMRGAKRVRVIAPIKSRISFLIKDYDHITKDPDELIQSLSKLKRFYPRKTTENWEKNIKLKNWETIVSSLLEIHYDPTYIRSTAERQSREILQLQATTLKKEDIIRLAEELSMLDTKR